MSTASNQRFFIALLPPQPIQDEAQAIQQDFADRFGSRAAQKSPPHITLQPPFEWSPADTPPLIQHLEQFAAHHDPVPITLDGFAAFPPRVIFINVARSQALLDLQSHLGHSLASSLNLIDQHSPKRPFHPHLTVAFRDLTKQNYHRAWPEFAPRSLHYEWLATDLTLLRHTGHHWIVHQQFPFIDHPAIATLNR